MVAWVVFADLQLVFAWSGAVSACTAVVLVVCVVRGNRAAFTGPRHALCRYARDCSCPPVCKEGLPVVCGAPVRAGDDSVHRQLLTMTLALAVVLVFDSTRPAVRRPAG